MNTEDQERLKQSVNDIAAILYRNTPPEQVTTLKGIETAIRQHAQQSVLPQLALFLQLKRLEQAKDTPEV
jgi:outer membrane PBP1 activator LpoA protein